MRNILLAIAILLLPSCPLEYSTNTVFCNSKFGSQNSVSNFARDVFGTDLIDLIPSEFCTRAILATPIKSFTPTLYCHIRHIVFMRSNPEVFGVYAHSVITRMQYVKSDWNSPSMDYPTQAMGVNASMDSKNTDINAPVSCIREASSPIPARIRFFDLIKESPNIFVRQVLNSEVGGGIVYSHSKYCLRATLQDAQYIAEAFSLYLNGKRFSTQFLET